MTANTPLCPSLADQIDNLGRARVLVVGDIILDRFIYGEVNRLSSEAPVPILNISRENTMPGGAGNTLGNLAALGAHPRVVSITGRDAAAQTLKAELEQMGIAADGLVPAPDRQTPVKIRYLSGPQQMLCVHDETLRPVPPETEDQLCRAIDAALGDVNVVVLSDYGRGAMTEKVIRHAIQSAKAVGVTVLVDPRHTDFSIYRGADLITPNRKELSLAIGGRAVKTDEEVESACRLILDSCGVGAVLATRSQDGMTLISKTNPPQHLRAQAREVFDVSGAGDTVIATLAAFLSIGADLESAARAANLAGGIVVGKAGTAKIYPAELKEAILHGDEAHPRRILSREAMLDQVHKWKAQGKKVGLTNGCFDILHKGHVAYLQTAKSRCDYLIIGLNADSSVRRLKGPARPFNSAESRADVLAALACVDGVVVFADDPAEGDTACTLAGILKPDFYFKAGDYTIDTLPEAPIVQAAGGRVDILPFEDGYSTTATLNRMNSAQEGQNAA